VTDVAMMGVFCALWVVLNLTLGPLSFRLLQLPVLHDFAAFFTLLLVTWATGKFGTASMVGVIGSVVAILLGGPPQIAGFAASAVLFDVLMLPSHHRLRVLRYNLLVATVATIVSAYWAGVIIGDLFTTNSLEWALVFWGGWHAVGGVISIAISLPIIVSLERANVRKIKSE
jgi:hypothetical protein